MESRRRRNPNAERFGRLPVDLCNRRHRLQRHWRAHGNEFPAHPERFKHYDRHRRCNRQPAFHHVKQFAHLPHIALRNGALGSGAQNQAQAVDAETALIRAGEAILTAFLDPAGNQIFVNEDTKRVMAMGWSYAIGSTRNL